LSNSSQPFDICTAHRKFALLAISMLALAIGANVA
jgi:hypothetical protein